MATTEADRNLESGKPVLRMDGPHSLATARGGEPAVSVLASSAAAATEEGAEQMQLHATQLAQHLQDRRRDVDHREAQLNARIAQLESELRLSRLWQREQSQEFGQREAEIRQQLSEHESRAVAVAAAELELESSRKKFAEETQQREATLARRELLLEESQKRLAQEAERLQQRRAELVAERDEFERQQLERELHACERLDQEAAEASHSDRPVRRVSQESSATPLLQVPPQLLQEWKQEWTEWQQWMQQRESELSAEQETLRVKTRTWQEEREQLLHEIERDRRQLDQRQNTLERIRGDVRRLHREALEMRLIAEQLWAQLAGRFAPAELTASVTKLRSQLADEYRLATQELQVQRAGLHELIVRLDQKQQELGTHRAELLDWFRRRQADLANKSAELAERNQRLAQERQQLAEQRFESQMAPRSMALA